jgi:hypothetical protein
MEKAKWWFYEDEQIDTNAAGQKHASKRPLLLQDARF